MPSKKKCPVCGSNLNTYAEDYCDSQCEEQGQKVKRYKYVWHIATYKDEKPSKGRQITRKEAIQLGTDVNRMTGQAKRLGEVYYRLGLGGIYCTRIER